jgi:hypothetical protein
MLCQDSTTLWHSSYYATDDARLVRTEVLRSSVKARLILANASAVAIVASVSDSVEIIAGPEDFLQYRRVD